MAKRSMGARVAEALAIGIGAGMEGYGKGTMAMLLEQRKAALEEVRDRRAAQESAIARDWQSGESEKSREFQREQDAASMAWEREKFGLTQAAEDARLSRSLGMQERLAKVRGSGEASAAKDDRTADQKNIAYVAGLMERAEAGDKAAQRELEVYREVKGLNAATTSAEATDPAQYAKNVNAGVEEYMLANPGADRANARAAVMREFADMGYHPPKGVKIPDAPAETAPTEEGAAKEGWGGKWLSGLGGPGLLYAAPSGAAAGNTEAKAGPTPPPESVSPSQAAQAPPKVLGGTGRTRDNPIEVTSVEELEAVMPTLEPGQWIRYKNKLYQKKSAESAR